MFKLLYFLIVLFTVSIGSKCLSSTKNEVITSANCIETAGEEIRVYKNLTFNRGGLKVISFLATFLRFIGTTRLTISVKKDNHKGQGCVPDSRASEERKPQFRTSLPVVNLGDFANYYYFETALKLNYFEAFEFCRKNHMYLLSIEAKHEEDLVKQYLFNKFPNVDSIWTSGSDLGKEGRYIWLSTGQPFTYTNWHPVNVIEPNNAFNQEHCIHIYRFFNSTNFYFWNDMQCGVSYHFVCETEPILL